MLITCEGQRLGFLCTENHLITTVNPQRTLAEMSVYKELEGILIFSCLFHSGQWPCGSYHRVDLFRFQPLPVNAPLTAKSRVLRAYLLYFSPLARHFNQLWLRNPNLRCTFWSLAEVQRVTHTHQLRLLPSPHLQWWRGEVSARERTSPHLGNGRVSPWALGVSHDCVVANLSGSFLKEKSSLNLPRLKKVKWMKWLPICMKEAVRWVELMRAEVSHGVLSCEYNCSSFRNEHVCTWPLFSTKASQALASMLTQTTRGSQSRQQEPDIWSRSRRLDGSARKRHWEIARLR